MRNLLTLVRTGGTRLQEGMAALVGIPRALLALQGLAAAGLPQAYEPGKGMIAIAGGTYQGQSAIAFGFSEAFSDEHTVIKASASYDSRGKAGASVGMGYQS